MRFFSLLLLLCGLAFGQNSAAQHSPSDAYVVPKRILSIKPQGFILGFNAQFEHPLSNTWSLQHELYYRGWQEVVRQNEMLAVATNLKWYFTGEVGKGLYLRMKAMGGAFLEPSRSRDYTNFAGLGFGLGVQQPIGRRWFYGFDLGIKLVPPFGGESKRKDDRVDTGPSMDYFLVSPASFFDIGFSIGYRL